MKRARSRHASRQSGSRQAQRRYLAHQIARLMWEESIEDFRLAKEKAVRRFGLRQAELPDNQEIAQELGAYSALFAGDQVNSRREILLLTGSKLMQLLEDYSPRLVGLEPEAALTPNSSLHIHVFSEHPEALDLFLQERGIGYQLEDRRFRFGREEYEYRPTYEFVFEGIEVKAAVFADLARSRVPLSPVDGRPMSRLTVRQVSELLEQAAAS